MCAFNAALSFGKDMLELSASTFGRLVGIQLTDLTTFLEHHSVAIYRAAEVRDVAALVALQRTYREAFWKDRRDALAATTEALQVASRVVAKSWTDLVSEGGASTAPTEQKPATKKVKRKPVVIEQDLALAPLPIAPARTKSRSPPKIAVVPPPAEPREEHDASLPVAKKRNPKVRKGAGGTRSPPTATR